MLPKSGSRSSNNKIETKSSLAFLVGSKVAKSTIPTRDTGGVDAQRSNYSSRGRIEFFRGFGWLRSRRVCKCGSVQETIKGGFFGFNMQKVLQGVHGY